MRIHWLQHVAFEDLGCIAPALAQRGDRVGRTRLYAGEPLPELASFDALIVMGGPMNIYEHHAHPWLRAETELIRAAADQGKRVLGICLGSQLLAAALGGSVTRNAHTEIGWFEITLNDKGRKSRHFKDFPEHFTGFHWHGDTFSIPTGAHNLMASAACAHQALELPPHCVGIQFHLEVTAANAREWFAQERPDASAYVQDAETILVDLDGFASNNRLMLKLLENWLG